MRTTERKRNGNKDVGIHLLGTLSRVVNPLDGIGGYDDRTMADLDTRGVALAALSRI